MGSPTIPYSPEEDAICRAGVTAGESSTIVQRLLPHRSVGSVSGRMSMLRNESMNGAISDDRRYRSGAEAGSAALRERIMDLLARTAVRRGVTLHEAARAALAHRPTMKGA